MEVYRDRLDGDRFLPHRNRLGSFVLGDPKHGSEKHHAKHKVFVGTLEEAVHLVETRGFSLWMKGLKSKQLNLISPDEIHVIRG